MAYIFKPEETKQLLKQVEEAYNNLMTVAPTAFDTFKETLNGVWHHVTEIGYEQAYQIFIQNSLENVKEKLQAVNDVIQQTAEMINTTSSGETWTSQGDGGESITIGTAEQQVPPLTLTDVNPEAVTIDTYNAASPEWIGFAPNISDDEAVSTIKTGTEKLRNDFETAIEKLTDVITALPEAINADGDGGNITEMLTEIVTSVKTALSTSFSNAKESADGTLDSFVAGLSTIRTAATTESAE